jgi:tripartite-type tricarboxylate transporter receptor subunit TctC
MNGCARRRLLFAGLGLIGAFAGAVALAQSYPVRPVRIIVPFPPGGGADNLGRIVGQKLSEQWGQQVVIDNRVGAGGNVGTALAARAAPDGYTLAVTSTGIMAINPFLYAQIPYDPLKDFAPVSMGIFFPHVIVMHPSIPVKTVADLLKLAKARPGEITYSSAGVGTPNHLAGELINTMTGVKLLHVPYKGTGPQIVAVLGGEVALSISPFPPALPHVKSGRLRALAVTTLKRVAQAPEVPTADESGLKGFEVIAWNAFLAPAGIPNDILAKLNADIVHVLGLPEVKARFAADGSDPWGTTPEEFGRLIRAEMDKWGKVVRASGARAE